MKDNLTKKLLDTDLVGRLQPFVDRNEFGYTFMGNETIMFPQQTDAKSPWLYVKNRKGNKCSLWHTVYFGIHKIIPQHCFKHCWKVVASHKGWDGDVLRQLTMSDLMYIYEIQKEYDWPSKCGMDTRDYTPTIWGAYWYCDSLTQARAVKFDVEPKIKEIDERIQVIVKRSCTEFELYLGESNKWDELDITWKDDESVLENWIYQQEDFFGEQADNELLVRNVKNRFLYWAHKHGDMTYREFTDQSPLIYRFPETKDVEIVPSITY